MVIDLLLGLVLLLAPGKYYPDHAANCSRVVDKDVIQR
jgi:hypothetical protein